MRNFKSNPFSSPKTLKEKVCKQGRIEKNTTMEVDKSRQKAIHALIEDPVRRKMVIDLINANKHLIDQYEAKHGSPLQKVKQQFVYESPTALAKRKALQNKDKPSTTNPNEDLNIEPSSQPLNQVLRSVIAFVEVNNRGTDCSKAIQFVLKKLGARVSGKFDRSVTHVVYKDGCYDTYNRAKQHRKHLVSILWLDSCYTYRRKMPEAKFPLFGNHSVTTANSICDKFSELAGITINAPKRSQSESDSVFASSKNNFDIIEVAEGESDEILINDKSITLKTTHSLGKNSNNTNSSQTTKISDILAKYLPKESILTDIDDNNANATTKKDSDKENKSERLTDKTVLAKRPLDGSVFQMESPAKRRRTIIGKERLTKSVPRPKTSRKTISTLSTPVARDIDNDNDLPTSKASKLTPKPFASILSSCGKKRRLFNPDQSLWTNYDKLDNEELMKNNIDKEQNKTKTKEISRPMN